jgi:hypothetical protein
LYFVRAACESGVGEEAKSMLQRVMPEHVVSAMMRGEKVTPNTQAAFRAPIQLQPLQLCIKCALNYLDVRYLK